MTDYSEELGSSAEQSNEDEEEEEEGSGSEEEEGADAPASAEDNPAQGARAYMHPCSHLNVSGNTSKLT